MNSAQLIDDELAVYDLAVTEHTVIDADAGAVYRAARDLDFLEVRSPLLTASLFVRGLPARLSGRSVPAPPELRLSSEGTGLPGWVFLGEVPGRELVFGAVGRFWSPDIVWKDVPAERFADFDEPGWGKVACHLLVRPDGPGRAVLSYECRTATTDQAAHRAMARYWTVVRPFVSHIMRATLRTVAAHAGAGGEVSRAG